MGARIGDVLRAGGHEVRYCPAGRSPRTLRRAQDAGLLPVDRLEELCEGSEILLSLCPPEAALDVAQAVAAAGFTGLYVDANAVNPERMRVIDGLVTAAGATVVDGCLIGPVPTEQDTTRLYLAGHAGLTGEISALFTGSLVQVVVLDGPVGAASALKIAHSSFAKTSRVLAALAHALAAEYGVAQALTEEARRRSRPALAEPDFFATVAARAWRWAPELAQAAESYRTVGLPDTMLRGAEELLRAWSEHKNIDHASVDMLLSELRSGQDDR
jgi:3-hydroxyisobutyrate dehydrogenase-like beta-hydroxyacid dehydrogenase